MFRTPRLAPARPPHRPSPLLTILCLIALTFPTPPSTAQDRLDNFADSQLLVFNADGHRSQVNRLLFTPDGSHLLSAGDDKVILLWSMTENPPRITRTLRPLIWKGFRGNIEDMALVAAPDADPQSGRLIVGGYGLEAGAGTLAVFRYPGLPERTTGDLLAHWVGVNEDEQPVGHRGTVRAMAAEPHGRRLATAGFDGMIHIWDVDQGAEVILLTDGLDPQQLKKNPDTAGLEFTSLAWTSQSLIVAGASDGLIRVWNLNQGPDHFRQPLTFRGDAGDDRYPTSRIQCLAVSPNGQFLVVGLSNPRPDLARMPSVSSLFLFNLPDGKSAGAWPCLKPAPREGDDPFMGLALAIAFRDDNQCAVALAAHRVRTDNENQLPGDETFIEIRAVPTGEVLRRVVPPDLERRATWPGLTRALQFSPDGKRLALVEGDTQRIFLHDMNGAALTARLINSQPVAERPDAPPLVHQAAAGSGTAIHAVRFVRNAPTTLAFSRLDIDPDNPPDSLLSFDLATRQKRTVAPGEVLAPLREWQGYRVEPVSAFRLNLINPQGEALPIALDPTFQGRWWDYCFVPPPPEGGREPCLALACDYTISIHRLDRPAVRTHSLRGHFGSVYTLATSPDGRWLVSGSLDQTIRLWSLRGCDETRPLGATFRQEGDRWLVDQVQPFSNADREGLKPGDTIVELWLVRARNAPATGYETQKTPPTAELLAQLDSQEPELTISMTLERPGQLKPTYFSTSKRDDPALNLFCDLDEEWIVWMPQGYYETSIQGDARYLGWQVNKGTLFNPQPPEYHPIRRFEDLYRKPAVIDRLLETGRVEDALALVVAPVPDWPLTLVVAPEPAQPGDLLRPPDRDLLQVLVPSLPLRVSVPPEPNRRLARLRIHDNGMIEQDLFFDPPIESLDQVFNLQIGPGQRSKRFEIVSDTGRSTIQELLLEGPEPVTPTRSPRLILLAMAAETFAAEDTLAIPGAQFDADDTGPFLEPAVLEPASLKPYNDIAGLVPLDSARELAQQIQSLVEEVRQGTLGVASGYGPDYIKAGAPIDTVVLYLVTHVLEKEGEQRLLGADFDPAQILPSTIDTAQVTADLSYLVEHGCRVYVFLDGIHLIQYQDYRANVDEWIRDLQDRRIGTFVASINGQPSQKIRDGHGVFTDALLQILQGQARHPYPTPLTPDSLGAALFEEVHELTTRRQHAKYIPSLTTWDRTPLVSP